MILFSHYKYRVYNANGAIVKDQLATVELAVYWALAYHGKYEYYKAN